MALDIMDRRHGQFLHFPKSGSWFDQDEFIISACRHAWRTWYIYSIDDAERSASDIRFMDWIAYGDN